MAAYKLWLFSNSDWTVYNHYAFDFTTTQWTIKNVTFYF